MSNYKLKAGYFFAKEKPLTKEYLTLVTSTGYEAGSIPTSFVEESEDWEKMEESQEWKVGEWLFYENCGLESIIRFKEIKRKNQVWHTEHYGYDSNAKYFSEGANEDWNIIDNTRGPATKDQIERILSIVARHKGYVNARIKVGTGFSFAFCHDTFEYSEKNDVLYSNSWVVYSKGTWAKIVEEPKAAEPDNEGLVELPRPIGQFIFDNLSQEKMLETQNGAYIHYSDVCTLLKKYKGDKAAEPQIEWYNQRSFSFSNILDLAEDSSTKIGGVDFIIVPLKKFEEEAKKRTNQ